MTSARATAHAAMSEALVCLSDDAGPHDSDCDELTAAIEARDREVIEACAQEALGGYVGPAQKEAAARIRALAIPTDGGKP